MAPPTLNPEYDQHVVHYATKYKVDPDLVRAVIGAESQGNPGAVSKKGAVGLMQLMPSLSAFLKIDPRDPRQNVYGGTAHLADMLKLFGGDVTKAVAAYNAGEVPVKRANGVPPIQETQQYVKRVMDNYNSLKAKSQPPATGAGGMQDLHPDLDVQPEQSGPPKKPFSGTHFSDAQIDGGVLHGSRRGSSPQAADAHRIHLGNGAPAGVYVYNDHSVGHPQITGRKNAYRVSGDKAIAQIESEPIWMDTLKKSYQDGLAGGKDQQTAFFSAINDSEHALRDAGYDGYTSSKQPHTTFLFGDQQIDNDPKNIK